DHKIHTTVKKDHLISLTHSSHKVVQPWLNCYCEWERHTQANDDRLPVRLWSPFATNVGDAFQTYGQQSLIIVLRFVKIKRIVAFPMLTMCWGSPLIRRCLRLNHFFSSKLPRDDLALAIVDFKPLTLVNGVSENNDFFIHTPRKTIVENCILMCTIAKIDADMGWCYLGCNVCSKKVLRVLNDDFNQEYVDDSLRFSYYCNKFKTDNPKILPKYESLY
ncbi:unnamed protein product, partial [Thlaspi arvense]